MISLIYVFWMYVILFAVIGFLRGWAKELLVGFSVIVAVAFNFLLRRYALPENMAENDITLFWIRIGILIGLVYFGYQTVISVARFQAAGRRERLQDSLFGLFLGAINGYLISGTFWYYLHKAEYPLKAIQYPSADEAVNKAIEQLIYYMPPRVLGDPWIYFAVIIVLIFILVVYV
jgi:lysylphosphatidylglycerol synthetase-like protein (DUF2156 family)